MQTRTATILAQEDLGAAGTKVIDLNLKDLISRIAIKFQAINGADGVSAHPAANISKIELVDGSDVLYSLSGHQAQAINWYDREKIPWTYVITANGKGQDAYFGLDFGRYLYDKALAFDPTKFINPQLKITYDEDVAQTDCEANTCTVTANIFDEAPPTPTGFFTAKEIYSYIAATSGYHYIDLPTDLVTNQIFVKALLSACEHCGEIAAYKLSEDNDRKVPLDLTSFSLRNLTFEQWGFVEEHAKLHAATGLLMFYGMPTDQAHAMGSPEGFEEDFTVWSLGGGYYCSENPEGTRRARVKTIGVFPHGTMPLLPKPGPEIEDWYKTNELGSLRLRIEDDATTADTLTVEVMVKQYRPY